MSKKILLFTTSPRFPHHFLTPLAYIALREGTRVAGRYADETRRNFIKITDAFFRRSIGSPSLPETDLVNRSASCCFPGRSTRNVWKGEQ